MKRKLILAMAVILLACPMVFASGIDIYFSDNAIKSETGGSLSDSNYHNYLPPLEFFYAPPGGGGGVPAPNSGGVAAGRKADSEVGPYYTHTGGRHNYPLSTLNGGRLDIRVWKNGGTAIAQLGNYYGKTSGACSTGLDFPIPLNITTLATSYKAAVPNMPVIGVITEALTRTGDTYDLNLSIPISYDPANSEGRPSDGLREIQDVYMLVTYPDAHTETKPGSPVGLTGTPAGTYKFKPYAHNWFGTTEGPEVTYTTGAMGGAAGPVTYELKRKPDGIGLNAVAVLHTVPFYVSNSPTDANSKAAVTKIRDLIAAINAKSGANNTVTTFGWMVNSEFRGLYLTYNEAGEMTGTPTVGVTEGLDTPLIRGVSYQIGVHRDVEGGVTFSQ